MKYNAVLKQFRSYLLNISGMHQFILETQQHILHYTYSLGPIWGVKCMSYSMIGLVTTADIIILEIVLISASSHFTNAQNAIHIVYTIICPNKKAELPQR